jgi:hypothetical protein
VKRLGWAALAITVTSVVLPPLCFADRSEAVPTLPGWRLVQQEAGLFQAARDDDVRLDDAATVQLTSGPSANHFATVAQMLDAGDYRGKRLRVSAVVRSSAVIGGAGLSVTISEGRHALWVETTEARSVRGTTDWTPLDIVVDVPPTATSIGYGMFLDGTGASWCGRARAEIVGTEIPLTREDGGHLRDGDFESPVIEGWFGGGGGKREYINRIVSDVRHGGRRGLMLRLGPDGDAATYGTVEQFFDGRAYAGKRVRASVCSSRTASPSEGTLGCDAARWAAPPTRLGSRSRAAPYRRRPTGRSTSPYSTCRMRRTKLISESVSPDLGLFGQMT